VQKRPKGFVVKEPVAIPTGVNGAMACVHNDDLFLAGGANGTVTLTSFRKFNLLTRKWTDLALLPRGLEGGVLSVVGGNIYLFGGGVMVNGAISTYNANLYKYDIENNVWSTLSASPLGGRRLFTGEAIGRVLYYFGGWNGAEISRVESFNLDTGAWTTLPNLPGIRHGNYCATDGSKIYIFGGLTDGGGTSNNDVLVFDPSVSTSVTTLVTTLAKPPVRSYSMLYVEENNLYVYGGYENGNGTAVRNDFWVLNLATKEWKQIPLSGTPIDGRGSSAYTYWKGELHVIGGYNPTRGRITDHIYIM